MALFCSFDQVKPGQQPQKPAPVTHTDKEESGTWDWITEPIADAWEWTADKASAALNWTKETASAFWDGIVDMFSKIAEVTVDAFSAAWNWILEHETLSVVVLTIPGIAAVFFSRGLVSAVGIGILGGEILGGIISWFSGNEFMSEAMLEDMLIWRIGTGIGAIVFELIAPFVTGLPFVAAIAGKVPWLGKALPKMFVSAAGGGTDQSIIDFLKGQFSWKKTAIVAGLCFVFALGGNYIGNYSDDLIKWINNRNVPNFQQLFISNNGNSLSSTVPKRVGDTPLGQWLQKFAAKDGALLGANGVQVTSKTVWKAKGSKARIDVENPNPGKRPGQIHYQDENNVKYYFDSKRGVFYNQKTGEIAPKKVMKMLKDKDFVKKLNVGLTQYLGEKPYKPG